MYGLIGLVLTPAHCTNLKNFHVTLVRLVCIIEILAIGSPYFEFWPLIGGRGKQWKHGRFFPKNRRYFSNFKKNCRYFFDFLRWCTTQKKHRRFYQPYRYIIDISMIFVDFLLFFLWSSFWWRFSLQASPIFNISAKCWQYFLTF